MSKSAQFPYKQLVLIEFHNSAPFLYWIHSKKKITIDKVAEYFLKEEGWNADRDNITFIDAPSVIEL